MRRANFTYNAASLCPDDFCAWHFLLAHAAHCRVTSARPARRTASATQKHVSPLSRGATAVKSARARVAPTERGVQRCRQVPFAYKVAPHLCSIAVRGTTAPTSPQVRFVSLIARSTLTAAREPSVKRSAAKKEQRESSERRVRSTLAAPRLDAKSHSTAGTAPSRAPKTAPAVLTRAALQLLFALRSVKRAACATRCAPMIQIAATSTTATSSDRSGHAVRSAVAPQVALSDTPVTSELRGVALKEALSRARQAQFVEQRPTATRSTASTNQTKTFRREFAQSTAATTQRCAGQRACASYRRTRRLRRCACRVAKRTSTAAPIIFAQTSLGRARGSAFRGALPFPCAQLPKSAINFQATV